MSATIPLDLIPVRALNQVTYCPRLVSIWSTSKR